MSDGPTRGASESHAWSASPGWAVVVRIAVFVLPIAMSFVVARLASPALWHPAGWTGLVVFGLQIAVVGSATALLSERALRRLLPLATLLNMTLVFPDRAPSRFGLALRAGSMKRLQASLDDGLRADHQAAAEQLVELVSALGRHERLTRGHTERVRAHCDLIAEQLGLPDTDRQQLAWAAMIHDIGKLSVPAEVLNLQGRPNDEQWARLRHHPTAGGELVEPLASWLGEWRLAASQHHERWDGTGYPNGLAGTDISLAGRIVAVADAYDVITSSRSYKKAMSPEAARDEMVRCSGTQFDPTVVRALLQASLGRERYRVGFLGWFSELGGFAVVPRTVAQAATTTTTAAVVTVATVTGAAAPGFVETIAPDSLEAAPPIDLPFAEADEPGGVADPVVTARTKPIGKTDASGATSTSLPALIADQSATETSTAASPTDPTVVATGDTPSTTTGSSPTTAVTTPTTPPQQTTTTTTAAPTTTTSTAAPTTTSTTTTTTSTTTTTTTTTTVPPSPADWDLGAGGYTTTQAFLPLEGALQAGGLPNYDTDKDSDPGLMVQKGQGLSESDATKMQRWSAPSGGDRLNGAPRLTIWVATKSFDTGKTGRFATGLYDCDAGHGGCTLLTSRNTTFNQAAFGNTFGQVTVDLPSIDHTFATDRTLVVKVAPLGTSDDDLWLAYGTTTFPTNLTIS